MAKLLPLTLDELLTTPRSVRKRLDLERPVDHETITECLQIAVQAPAASNMQHWSFVVVTDPAKRAALAAIYKRAWDIYLALPVAAPNLSFPNADHQAMQSRVTASAQYLADHLHEVPVFVPCLLGRIEAEPLAMQSASWGTICPATCMRPLPREGRCGDAPAGRMLGIRAPNRRAKSRPDQRTLIARLFKAVSPWLWQMRLELLPRDLSISAAKHRPAPPTMLTATQITQFALFRPT